MAQPPTGLTRRRRRLTDAQTERRMLDAGVAMVGRTGLTVSVEHLGFEDVIREAQVSRSTVYRRWPYKDLYFSDLLRELATGATPAAVSDEATALAGIARRLRERLDWLADDDRRLDLLLDVIRDGVRHDFETMRGSVEWRTYLALHATYLSVEDAELRTDLESALAHAEQSFVDRIADAWERLGTLLGYRLRPGSGMTFEVLARLLSADLRGHVLMALASPDAGDRTVMAQPPGTAGHTAWTLPALAAAGIALTYFEPDPSVEWTEARITSVRAEIAKLGGTQEA